MQYSGSVRLTSQHRAFRDAAYRHLQMAASLKDNSLPTSELSERERQEILGLAELDSLVEAAAETFFEHCVQGKLYEMCCDWTQKKLDQANRGGHMSSTDDKINAMINQVEAFVQKGERLLSDLQSIQGGDSAGQESATDSNLKERVIASLTNDAFASRLSELIGDTKEDPATHAALQEMGLRWIGFVRKMFEPVEDNEEVAFMASQICGALRSNWFIINTAMGYKMAKGEFDAEITYAGSLVSMILEALEPFAHEPSLGQIYTAISSKAA